MWQLEHGVTNKRDELLKQTQGINEISGIASSAIIS